MIIICEYWNIETLLAIAEKNGNMVKKLNKDTNTKGTNSESSEL